jgi:predicted TIM-barrel fold metal-dependent hydrolase
MPIQDECSDRGGAVRPADVDRYRVIDTDTHVMEPYDLWTSRVSVARWGDLVPHVRWDPVRGEDMWFHGDTPIGAGAGAAQAGWHEFPPNHPPSLDAVDPATWEPQARLAKMDDFGVWAQILYPNVAGFGAGRMLTFGDPELMLACVRAYNDFLAEYVSADPQRFVAVLALPMWDIDLCLQEVARGISLGHRGVIMTGHPHLWGLPPIGDPHW